VAILLTVVWISKAAIVSLSSGISSPAKAYLMFIKMYDMTT
jgi:hypothetical protein